MIAVALAPGLRGVRSIIKRGVFALDLPWLRA
jgi:hypothetical protein